MENKEFRELNDNELDNVVGGGSYIVEKGSTDYWMCITWMHYCDGCDDNECKCDAFSSNDPVCLSCTHADKSMK